MFTIYFHKIMLLDLNMQSKDGEKLRRDFRIQNNIEFKI